MAKIVISLAGEGRGHATRIKTVVEALRREHQLILLAPSAAYELLAEAYQGVVGVSVRPIPGLHFRYRGQHLDYLKSLCLAVPYLWNMPRHVEEIEQLLRRERPDLAITDFEPLLPRAAAGCGVPYISFDHQHFLVVNDLSGLPWALRWKAWLLGLSIGLFYRRQRRTIVSSFYAPPLKPAWRDAVQTGVLLRPEILQAQPVAGDHLLVYMRRFLRDNLARALRQCGREVRIYGLGRRPAEGNLHYFEVDERRFIEDLVHCNAVVSNAGNQLVGEALYLRKPFLALPETGNFEQAINAHFLRASGGGDWVPFERLTAADLNRFLEQVPAYRRRIRWQEVVGNDAALAAIREELAAVRPLATNVPACQAA
jgi:uncharacterized protein (TIGR00661 family)